MALGSAKRSGWALKPGQLLWKLSDSARQAREARTLQADAALGRRGEDLAHRYLQKAGYAVVTRNYKPGADSEIDIVATKDELVVFVEVKSRSSAVYGAPERAMDANKQKNIVRGARAYATRAAIDWSRVRFDVISVVFTKPPSILHQQDAFFPSRRI
jgi:putative endonuclease